MRIATVLAIVMLGLAGCSDDKGGTPTTTDDPLDGDEQPRPEDENTSRDPMTWTVVIEGVAFVDGTFAILPGDTVRWVHQDGTTMHRVESAADAPAAFDSGDMLAASNGEFEFTFDVAGNYTYFCRYHEGAMTETIYVNANATIPAEEPEPEPEPNATGPPRGPVTWDVPIRGSAFVGGTLTVQAGDTVRWTHEDGTTPHTVTADDGDFDSGYMLEGPLLGEYEFTFDEVDEFPYHCDVHPSMQNTITVLERFDGTP